MIIKTLDKSGYAQWNDYLRNHSHSTICHLAEWENILRCVFKYNTHYFYAVENNRICGVLPLAHVKTLLFGNILISTPCCVYGGVCADDQKTKKYLEQEAIDLAATLKADYLELRQLQPDSDGWSCKQIYYTFVKSINADPGSNMQAVPRKQRAMIRKGIDAGLYSVIDDSVDRFYSIYSTSVRNLGSPVQSRKYFQALYNTFPGQCDILTVEKAGKPISSVFSFYYRDTVLPYYGGGLPEARNCKAYDFMYWELMRRSCEKGIKHFDFGRSIEGSGSFDFKKNWGFQPTPLYYRQYLVNSEHTPDFNPDNPRYRLYVNLWKKLPLAVANRMGPIIARGLT